MRHVLAIDQGTTGTTCLVIAADGRVAGRAYRELPQHFPEPGWVEHDAMDILSGVLDAGREAIAKAGVTPDAIGITNQRETTVVWDRTTGTPVYNAIVWQDTRTQPIVERLAGTEGVDRYKAKVGLPLSTYFSGTKIVWILENVDGARARALGGRCQAFVSRRDPRRGRRTRAL